MRVGAQAGSQMTWGLSIVIDLWRLRAAEAGSVTCMMWQFGTINYMRSASDALPLDSDIRDLSVSIRRAQVLISALFGQPPVLEVADAAQRLHGARPGGRAEQVLAGAGCGTGPDYLGREWAITGPHRKSVGHDRRGRAGRLMGRPLSLRKTRAMRAAEL